MRVAPISRLRERLDGGKMNAKGACIIRPSPARIMGAAHCFTDNAMTPEEQAELGLNGFFAYKGFRVRPGPTTNERIRGKGRPTIQCWVARHDRGTPTKNAGTVGEIKAWIDKQTQGKPKE
jgi:hypothetical protein